VASAGSKYEGFAGVPTVSPWAGGYVGFGVGGTWSMEEWRSNKTFPISYGSGELNPDGATVGGILGANFQQRNFVFSPEFDINWLGGDDTTTMPKNGSAPTASIDLNWSARARLRLGYSMGIWMPFVAAGAALINTTDSFANSAVPGSAVSSQDTNRVGFTAGAGFDVKVTPNVVFRAEYIYDDYGTVSIPSTGVTPPPFEDQQTLKLENQTLRAAVLFRLD
jgi:outer membrane immunogenic protein